MPKVLRKLLDYAPVNGDTLTTITAAQCPVGSGITWQEVAKFNWGTDNDDIVNQLLAETVGCNRPLNASAGLTVLNPANGIVGVQIRIPEIWDAPALAMDNTHTLKLSLRRPPPIVQITALDKWFVPESETCELDYYLRGVTVRADTVDLEVYASNYCEVAASKDGEFDKFAYTPLAPFEVPIVKEPLGPLGGTLGSHNYRSWKGESHAAKGILKPREGKNRHINVANSPYTVMFRYFKKTDDRKAVLFLEPFWPRFDATPALIAGSAHIKWRSRDCAKIKHGQLIVTRADGTEVFHKALVAADFMDGPHAFNWNPTAAGINLIMAEMPYRVQIQGHSAVTEDEGLALAAMHTEVRLYAHDDNGTLAATPVNETSSFEIQVAPTLPLRTLEKPGEDTKPKKGSFRWYKHKLAEYGFHPGPVHEDSTNDDFELAMKEFQRSVPENLAAPFKRFKVDGKRSSSAEALLDNLQAPRRRALFGNDANRADLNDVAVKADIKDKTKTLIVWVDDRHYFTDFEGKLPNKKMGMDDYRGKMDIGDDKQDHDTECIARPWIPLEMTPRLLSRSDVLFPNPPAAADNIKLAAMRRAIGPLRVDWTFIDAVEDYNWINAQIQYWDKVANAVQAYNYDPTKYRPRRFVRDVIEGEQVVHNGITFTNCKETAGGIRPATITQYFKKAFALDEKSLYPWKAVTHDAVEKVQTIIHDDLGQAPTLAFPTHVGKAGVYFNPSRIAGDGYFVRAQISFLPWQGGLSSHPNRDVLADRYPFRPQAHTAKLRIWRKDSYRGHLGWCPPIENHWLPWRDLPPEMYKPAYIHFVHEAGAASPTVNLATLLTSDDFKKVIADTLEKANKEAKKSGGQAATDAKSLKKMEKKKSVTLDVQHVWPYSAAPNKHFGIMGVPPGGMTVANYLKDNIQDRTWRMFRDALLMKVLAKYESTEGLLRGHFLAEFNSSPDFRIQKYRCDTCSTDQELLETMAAHSSGNGEDCRDPGCGGKIKALVRVQFTCGTCGVVQTFDNQLDRVFAAPACTTGACAGVVTETNRTRKIVNGGNLPFNASASSLGATWLFSDAGHPETWAHEMGHHHHMEHAAGAPGAVDAQHDHGAIAGHGGPEPNWGRHCLMGYIKTDPRMPCGKCLLKLRGWKIQNPAVADPAGANVDP